METKKCIKCQRVLPKEDFYEEKHICKLCYRRWARRKRRIQKGYPIKTVGELIRELSSFPYDAKVVLLTDIDFYHPTIVEYTREIFKDTKFDTNDNQTIVICLVLRINNLFIHY